MNIFRALPRWLWLVLLVAVLLAVQEVRVRWAVAERDALHEQQFRAVLGAIQVQREEQERELGALQGERTRLKADVAAHRQRADDLARRTADAGAVVERVTREGAELAAKGSPEDVVKAWERLGWRLTILPRVRP